MNYPFPTTPGSDYLSADKVKIADIPSDYTLNVTIAGFIFTNCEIIDGKFRCPGMIGDRNVVQAKIYDGSANEKWLMIEPILP